MAIFDFSLLDVVDLHILKDEGSLLVNSPSQKKIVKKILIMLMQQALQSLSVWLLLAGLW